jgi:Gram-negative bacterial TonB protein C-terminal
MKFYLLVIVMLFFFVAAFSQKDNNEYFIFDENWKGVKEVSQSTYMITIEKVHDSLFQFYYYYTDNNIIKLESFKDREAKIANGVFAWYNIAGTIDSFGTKINNQKDGTWIYFEPKTLKYDSVQRILHYKNNILISKESDEKFKPNYKEPFYTKWQKLLEKNFKYPEKSIFLNHQGITSIYFTVDQKGNVSDILPMKSIDYFMDREARRVINLSSGKWSPGLKNGIPVTTYHSQSIKFVLPN